MHSDSKRQSRLIWTALGRAWWGVLLLIHLHPLVLSFTRLIEEGFSVRQIAIVLGLAVLLVFFLLKLLNIGIFRTHARRETLIAFWVSAAIIHHGAVGAAVRLTAEEPAPAVVVTIAAAGGVLSRKRLTKQLIRVFRGLSRSLTARMILANGRLRWLRSTVRGLPVAGGILPFSLRGPPCLCG